MKKTNIPGSRFCKRLYWKKEEIKDYRTRGAYGIPACTSAKKEIRATKQDPSAVEVKHTPQINRTSRAGKSAVR
jgi:hypothetical protein